MQLVEHVQKGLEKFQDYSNHMNYKNVFFPTEMFIETSEFYEGKCKRYLYYKKNNYKQDKLDYDTIMNFERGNSQEASIIRAMQKERIWIEDGVKIYFDYNDIYISGEIDVLITDDTYGEQIVEIKTGDGYYFSQQVINGYKRDTSVYRNYMVDQLQAAPRIEHLIQTAIYLYYFKVVAPKKLGTKPIHTAQILYYDNSQRVFKSYLILLNQVNGMYKINVFDVQDTLVVVSIKDMYIEQILNSLNSLYTQYIATNIIPPRSYKLYIDDTELKDMLDNKEISKRSYDTMYAGDRADYHCRYCIFRNTCETEK